MATYYSSIATEQQPFLNFPGGGPVSNGTGSGFNDPALEIPKHRVIRLTSTWHNQAR